METDAGDARAQLNEFDEAVRTTVRAAWRVPSRWAFPLLALIGPAVVLGAASMSDVAARPDQPWLSVFRTVAVILGAIAMVAAFKEWRLERSREVKPRPPFRGGHMSKWLFAFSFSNILGLIVPLNLMSINNYERPLVLAICSYLWLAFVPPFFLRLHIKGGSEV